MQQNGFCRDARVTGVRNIVGVTSEASRDSRGLQMAAPSPRQLRILHLNDMQVVINVTRCDQTCNKDLCLRLAAPAALMPWAAAGAALAVPPHCCQLPTGHSNSLTLQRLPSALPFSAAPATTSTPAPAGKSRWAAPRAWPPS